MSKETTRECSECGCVHRYSESDELLSIDGKSAHILCKFCKHIITWEIYKCKVCDEAAVKDTPCFNCNEFA